MPDRTFQLSLIYESKTGAYPKGASFNYSSIKLRPGLAANVSLGCKSLRGKTL